MPSHLSVPPQLDLDPPSRNLSSQILPQTLHVRKGNQSSNANGTWDSNYPKIHRSVVCEYVPKFLVEIHAEISSEKRQRQEDQRHGRQLPHRFVLGGRHHIKDLL